MGKDADPSDEGADTEFVGETNIKQEIITCSAHPGSTLEVALGRHGERDGLLAIGAVPP